MAIIYSLKAFFLPLNIVILLNVINETTHSKTYSVPRKQTQSDGDDPGGWYFSLWEKTSLVITVSSQESPIVAIRHHRYNYDYIRVCVLLSFIIDTALNLEYIDIWYNRWYVYPQKCVSRATLKLVTKRRAQGICDLVSSNSLKHKQENSPLSLSRINHSTFHKS